MITPLHTPIWPTPTTQPLKRYPTIRTARNVRLNKRTIDRMVDPYIPLWHLETSSPEHSRANPTKYTSDRTFSNFRELTQTVNVLDLNNVNNTQNSSNVSPQQNLPGTGQQSEVNDGESPERHTFIIIISKTQMP